MVAIENEVGFGGFGSQALGAVLRTYPKVRRYRVAYSGGSDSYALLLALAALHRSLPGLQVDVLHVHHGLSPKAGDWASHCREVCDRLGLDCRILQVTVTRVTGEGPEAAARMARYDALAGQVRKTDAILTAHHRDDQAETLMLQLLRGCGVRGLAAMPAVTAFGQGYLMRPLLGFSRAELRAYLRSRAEAAGEDLGSSWVEDESNADRGLRRNFLRHEIIPPLQRQWPALARSLARTARHCAEAAELLEELGRNDLGGSSPAASAAAAVGVGLPVATLAALGPARQRNAVRVWLRDRGLPVPDTVTLGRVIQEGLHARSDANPVIRWAGGEVRRYRGRLYAMTPLVPATLAAGSLPERLERLPWDGRNPLRLPAGDERLLASDQVGAGLSAARLDAARVEIDFRRGGERCRPAGRGCSRPLKKLLQEVGVPPWLRGRLPLVRIDGALAAIADLVVCEPFQARSGEPGRVIRWVSEARRSAGLADFSGWC